MAKVAAAVAAVCAVIAASTAFDSADVGQACTLPNAKFVNKDVTFWCEHNAFVEIDPQGCDANVLELIKLPWSVGTEARVISLQAGQAIDESSIQVSQWYESINSGVRVEDVSFETKVIQGVAPLTQVTIQFHPEPTKVVNVNGTSTLWRIDYKLRNAVMQYVSCDGDEKSASSAAPGPSNMITGWRPGGQSTPKINYLNVTIETPPLSGRIMTTPIVAKPSNYTVLTNFVTRSNAQNLDFGTREVLQQPSLLNFMVVHGRQGDPTSKCPVVRSCAAEAQLRTLTDIRKRKRAVFNTLSAVCLFIVVLIGVLLCALCGTCLARGIKDKQNLKGEAGAELPSVVRHFAYDTGDDDEEKQASHNHTATDAVVDAAEADEDVSVAVDRHEKQPPQTMVVDNGVFDVLDIEKPTIGSQPADRGLEQGELVDVSRKDGVARLKHVPVNGSHRTPNSTATPASGRSDRSRRDAQPPAEAVSAKALLRDDFNTQELNHDASSDEETSKSVKTPRSHGKAPKSFGGRAPLSFGKGAKSKSWLLSRDDKRDGGSFAPAGPSTVTADEEVKEV
jgi:hypothetical protein